MLIPIILVVERLLRDAGIPIDGISIGNPNDRATWRAFYTAGATGPQRTQGDALLLSCDPQDVTAVANIKTDLATANVDRDDLTSMAQAVWEAIPSPLLTKAQVRARFIAILKTK